MKYLESSIEVLVRFSETDAMGVVWHGNYLKFFEDAREYFGREHGLEYLDCYNNGYFTPIVESQVSHKASVNYGESVLVKAKLIWKPSAKIVFEYEIINTAHNQIAAYGTTTQVFLSVDKRELELIKPEFIRTWEDSKNWIESE